MQQEINCASSTLSTEDSSNAWRASSAESRERDAALAKVIEKLFDFVNDMEDRRKRARAELGVRR